MFGRVNRQLAKIIAEDDARKESEDTATRALEKLRQKSLEKKAAEQGVDVSTLEEFYDSVRNGDAKTVLNLMAKHGASALVGPSHLGDPNSPASPVKPAVEDPAFWGPDTVEINAHQEAALAELPDEELRTQIRNRMRPGVIFDPIFRPATTADTSFFGGLPVAGTQFIWPRSQRNNRPFRFLGQVDMKDMPKFEARRHFPETGALLFFAPERRGTHAGAVVHVKMENASEVLPPEGYEPYQSGHRKTFGALGTGQIGWPHEGNNQLPPHSVLPKWPLAPRLAAFAPQNSGFYDAAIQIPDALHESYGSNPREFFAQFGKHMNGVHEELWQGQTEPFEGFPHVWGAIADITQRFLPMIDQSLESVRAEEGFDVSRLRREVEGWHDRARTAGFGAPVSGGDRFSFIRLLEKMSADSGTVLRGNDALLGQVELNSRQAMDELIRTIQQYWSLSSLNSDPSALPNAHRAEIEAQLKTTSSSHGHIQTLGHTHDVSGEETALSCILLMQFPFSNILDTTRIFGVDGLRFWMTPEDLRNQAFDKVYCEI